MGAEQLDIYTTRLITDAAIAEYQSSWGDFHHARFRLMMHAAGRAKRLGYALDVDGLVSLFNQVDAIDGGYYLKHEDQKHVRADAAKALTTAM